MRKFTRDYNSIISVENLLQAWLEFLNGKRSRVDVILFQNRLMDNVFDLYYELVNKTYIHGGYKSFNISDPKPRIIHKATVRDRLLHHLLYTQLCPYFEKKFIHDSYSCRLGKGTHRAMDRFKDFGCEVSKNNSRTCWVLKGDVRKFFASIDHSILKDVLDKYIDDKDLLKLLSVVIDSFATEGRNGVGLPLGNLTSQLLVNVYMDEFDQFVKRDLGVKFYIRYADDFVILSSDKKDLECIVPLLDDFLKNKLKLTLHPDKLFIKTLVAGVDFLGWVHFPKHRVIRTATKRRMLSNLAKSSGSQAVLNSYRGLLSHGNAWKLTEEIGKFKQ